MIAGLKPYREMKDTGLLWLGQVPDHWQVKRLKYLVRERDLRSADGREQLLRVSQYTGVTERRSLDGDDVPDSRAESLAGYKLVEPDDLVVNIMLAWNGSMGVSSFSGIASPAYCVYRFGAAANPWYFHHLLRSPLYKARIKAVSTGVVESRLRLYTDDLFRLEALVPPSEEQAAIVRFLDHADRRILRFIRAKQKLIKLLEEQKQAIIHRAVTRGLDPNVRLKPSGVEWLGDVPEHWTIRRCRLLFREIDSRSLDGTEQHLSMSQRLGLVPSNWVENRTLVSESYAGGKLCSVGDLVLNRLKAHLGVFSVARHAGVISPDYTVFRPIESRGAEYYERVLRSPACRRELRVRAKGIVEGFWRLYTDDFYDIRLPVPPPEERNLIVEKIGSEVRSNDEAISKAQREIDLLREYRTRLIADVVTGKLDVREAAARLPEEPEELEPFDDTIEADDDAISDDASPEEVEA